MPSSHKYEDWELEQKTCKHRHYDYYNDEYSGGPNEHWICHDCGKVWEYFDADSTPIPRHFWAGDED
jgi:hypothetical protein